MCVCCLCVCLWNRGFPYWETILVLGCVRFVRIVQGCGARAMPVSTRSNTYSPESAQRACMANTFASSGLPPWTAEDVAEPLTRVAAHSSMPLLHEHAPPIMTDPHEPGTALTTTDHHPVSGHPLARNTTLRPKPGSSRLGASEEADSMSGIATSGGNVIGDGKAHDADNVVGTK